MRAVLSDRMCYRGGLTARMRALLVSAGAVLCVAAPTQALAAIGDPTPTALPATPCATPPCSDPTAAQLTLTQTVDKPSAAVGDTVTYTVTVGNSGSLPAALVAIDDVLGGGAGYLVDDGTAGTVTSFMGWPVGTVTRVLTGHYRWSYATVNPGDSDVVRFSALVRQPGGAAVSSPRVVALTSTASAVGVSPAIASTSVTLPAVPPGGTSGAVKGVIARVPHTGTRLNLSAAGFLLLGGLGLILAGALARRRDELSEAAAPPPALSR